MSKISNVLTMLEYLSSGRKYSISELSEKLEVSPRMIRVYKDEIEKDDKDEVLKLKYCTYKYTADMVVFGHIYERKGDIRLREVSLYYTNLDKWIDWPIEIPEFSSNGDEVCLKIKKFNEKMQSE